MLRSLLAHIVTQWGPCPVATNCWNELNSLGSNWMDITTDLMRTAKEETAFFTAKSSFQKRSGQLKLDIVNNKEHHLGHRSTPVSCYTHRCSPPALHQLDVLGATFVVSTWPHGNWRFDQNGDFLIFTFSYLCTLLDLNALFDIDYFGDIFPLKKTRLDGRGLFGGNVSKNLATWFCKTGWIDAKWPKNTVCQSKVPHFKRLAEFFGKI